MSVAAGRIRIHLTHRCAQYYVGQCEQESFAHLPEFDFRRRITYFFGVTFCCCCVLLMWGGGGLLLALIGCFGVGNFLCPPFSTHAWCVYVFFLCCVVVLLSNRTIHRRTVDADAARVTPTVRTGPFFFLSAGSTFICVSG